MGDRNLGSLVVRLAVELARYKGDWQQAVAATQQGARDVEQAAGQAAKASDGLKEALVRQTGAFGEAAAGAGELGQAVVATTGASVAMAAAVGAGVVALGALGAAAYAGAREQRALNDSLLLTGNYAGLVTGQLDKMAVGVASSIGGTVANSREVLAGLVTTGRFTKDSLQEVGTAVQLVARYSGQSNEEVLKHFSSMADGVAKWAAKANEQYHFLDITTYRYIQQLEEQGQKQEAARVTSESLSNHLGRDLTQNLGYLEGAWGRVKKEASDAWEAMKGIGKSETVDQRLQNAADAVDRASRRVEFARRGGMLAGGSGAQSALATAITQQGVAQSDVIQERRLAAARSEQEQRTEAAIDADRRLTQIEGELTTTGERLAKKIKEVSDAYAIKIQAARDAGQGQRAIDDLLKKQAETEQRLREKYADKSNLARSQVDPYDQLIKSAQQRVALLSLELDGTQKLTEGEKALAKYESDLQQGYIKFNDAKDTRLRLTLQEQIADEKAIETRQRENKEAKEAADEYAKLVEASQKSAQRLKDETQRETEHAAALGLTKTQVAELTARKYEDAAASKERRAEMLAQLGLAPELIQALRDEAAGLRDLANAKRRSAQREEQLDTQKQQEKDWKQFVENIDKTFHDGYMQMLQRGKDGWQAWTKSLWNTFKTTVADEIYKAFIKPIFLSIIGNFMGAGGGVGGVANGAVQGGLGSALGSGIGAMFGAGGLSGSLMAGAGWLTGSTTLTGALSAAGSLMGTGTAAGMLSGVGMGLGALMPIGLGALAVASLLSGGGETRHGGQYTNSTFVGGPSGGQISGAADLITPTMDSINKMLELLGSSTRLQTFVSGLEQSGKGKGFAYAGGQLSTGAMFGQGMDGQGSSNRRGSMSEKEALAAYTEELKQATLQALQSANLGGAIGDYLKKLGDIDALSGDALDKALARVNKMASEKQALDDRLFELQHTAAEVRARDHAREMEALDESNRAEARRVFQLENEARIAQERSGIEQQLQQLQGDTAALRQRELDALEPANRALMQRVYALQDEQEAGRIQQLYTTGTEQRRAVASKISASLQAAGLNFSTDQVLNASREDARKLYEAYSRAGPAGAAYAKAIFDQAEAFATITPEMEDAAAAAREAAKEFARAAGQALVDGLQQGVNRAQKRLDEATQTLVNVYNREVGELQQTADRALADAERLRQARLAIDTSAQSGLPVSLRYLAAKEGLNTASRTDLPQAVSTFLDAARGNTRDWATFMADQDRGKDRLAREEAAARTEASVAERQIAAARSVVGSMTSLNDSVMTLTEALTGVKRAQGAKMLAEFNQSSFGLTGADYDQAYTELFLKPLVAMYGRSWEDFQRWQEWDAPMGGGLDAFFGFKPYASGGLASGRVLVGERGPELLDLQTPGRVYTAEQTAGMFVAGARMDDTPAQLQRIGDLLDTIAGNTAGAAKWAYEAHVNIKAIRETGVMVRNHPANAKTPIQTVAVA